MSGHQTHIRTRPALGYSSKTDTVVFALREVVRRGRVDELKRLMSKVEFDFDPMALRKRARTRARRQ